MSKNFLVFLFFISLSTEIFSETYVCSYDKEQHTDTGEGIGTSVYERKGKEFIQTEFGWVFKIDYESKKNLLLSDIRKYDPPLVMLVFIDKETMDFGIEFLEGDHFKNDTVSRTFGKCVVIN